MKNHVFNFLLLVLTITSGFSQMIIPLWPGEIPNRQASDEIEIREQKTILRISKVQRPTLTVFLPAPEKSNNKAVVICPGGGYGVLAFDWEGTMIAEWLTTHGFTAFVLKYRLPGSKSITIAHETPLIDAQRAIRTVRAQAKKWKIAPDHIGIIGFSAGGHLTASLGTQYDSAIYEGKDAIDSQSARPDFMALIYPVVSMKDGITHNGSRYNLLGKKPLAQLIDRYSNELHVNKDTPPTFLVHATDDLVVPVENSLLLYQALKDSGVSAEMHIYPKGGHGFSLAKGKGSMESWKIRFIEWAKSLQ